MEPRLFKIRLDAEQESAPFDGNALVAYVQSGHIQASTWVYEIQQGRWLAAEQIDILNGYWQARPGAYGAPQPMPSRSYGSQKVLISTIAGICAVLFLGFILLRPLVSKMLPSHTMTTTDGAYSMTVPSLWHEHPSRYSRHIEYVNIEDTLAFGISSFKLIPGDPDFGSHLFQRLVTNLTTKDNWVVDGSSQQITVGGYPALSQAFTDQKGLATLHNHIIVVSTPNGIYSITEVVQDNDPDGQAEMDKIANSFHSTGNQPAVGPSNPGAMTLQ